VAAPGSQNNDRWFFIRLYRWFPSILQVLTIVQPETLVRWRRAGFRCYWRWKSRLCLSEIKLAHTDDEVRQEMA